MNLRIDPHTLDRAAARGATLAEIEATIASGAAEPAHGGRLARARVFPFARERNGRFYPEKRIKVVYVVEGDLIVTVTVLVYYGKWEQADADPLR